MAKKNRNTGSENPEDESNAVSPRDYEGDEDTGHSMAGGSSFRSGDFDDIARYGNGNQSLRATPNQTRSNDRWFGQSSTSRLGRMRFGSNANRDYESESSYGSSADEGRYNEERYREQRSMRYSAPSRQREYNPSRDQYTGYDERMYGQTERNREYYNPRYSEYSESHRRSAYRDQSQPPRRSYASPGQDYGDYGLSRSSSYNDNYQDERSYRQQDHQMEPYEARYQRNWRRNQY